MCVRFVSVERHALSYLADFEIPTHPGHMGALVDNDVRVGVRMLETSDRSTVDAARNVFSKLFWTAERVRITSVWRITKA